MSAFLGPIHYWLYNKILLQEKLTEYLLADYQEIYLLVGELCGEPETRPLEEAIDTGNIHGWLQGQILIVEKRYAAGVHLLLERQAVTLDLLQERVFSFGKQYPMKGSTAPELYKELQDLLLDGMPCDHVNLLVEQDEEKVIWKRTADLHSSHWKEIGADGEIYYLLKQYLLEGMLHSTSYKYTAKNELCEITHK